MLVDLIKATALLQLPTQWRTFRRPPVYSVEQAGLLILLLDKLHPIQQGLLYKFSSSELSALTGLAHSFTNLQAITMELGSLAFTVQSGRSYEQYRLFQSVSYLLKQDEIQIKLAQDMLPCLCEWKVRLIKAGLLPYVGILIDE